MKVVPLTRITLNRVPPPVATWTLLMVRLWRSTENEILFSSTPRAPGVSVIQVLSSNGSKNQLMSSGGMAGGIELKNMSKFVVSKSEELTVTVSPAATERGVVEKSKLV